MNDHWVLHCSVKTISLFRFNPKKWIHYCILFMCNNLEYHKQCSEVWHRHPSIWETTYWSQLPDQESVIDTVTTQAKSASKHWCCLALLQPASRKLSGLRLFTSLIVIKSSSLEWNDYAQSYCSFPSTAKYPYFLGISAHKWIQTTDFCAGTKKLSSVCYRRLHGHPEIMQVTLLCPCSWQKLSANSELQVAGKTTIKIHKLLLNYQWKN